MVVRLAVLALVLGVAACTTIADVISRASGGIRVGEVRRGPAGDYRKLMASFNGWTVWETAVQTEIACFAIKAGNGRLSPEPAPASAIVTGVGGGFFVRQAPGDRAPTGGFYGSNAFVKTVRGEVDGLAYDAVPIDALGGWEGQSGFYDVSSGPHLDSEDLLRRDTGAIDFSGITRALALVSSCAAEAPTV